MDMDPAIMRKRSSKQPVMIRMRIWQTQAARASVPTEPVSTVRLPHAGSAEDVISATLIIADKTDVRRSRVREQERAAFDIHDRVNYAITESKLKIEKDRSVIALNLQVDEKICSMYDYFEIFLGRMMLCRKSAEILGTTFKLTVNGRKVL